MATFNGERHILEQLNSLASQTLRPCELVVTDDGSTDGTLAIIARFATAAPFPVRVYENSERLGYADNFLKAAQLCAGDFIAFCDQDDLWLSGKLLRCLKPFDDAEVLISGHTSRVWHGGENFGACKPHFQTYQVVPVSQADPLVYHLGFSTVIRKSLLLITNNQDRPIDMHSVGRARIPMAHDQWVWFLAALFGKSAEIPDILCFYRQHDNNVFGAAPCEKRSLPDRLTRNKAAEFRIGEEIGALSAMYIGSMLPSLPDHLRPLALKGRETLERRARLCRRRGKLYGAATSVAMRVAAVIAIFRQGGYSPAARQFGFGRAALLKDMIMGVTGLFKLFAQE